MTLKTRLTHGFERGIWFQLVESCIENGFECTFQNLTCAVTSREEAKRAAARAIEARRHAAAAVFQSRVRGAAGRRRAAVARVARTARGIAAWKIQRVWRRHHARARERAAVAAKAATTKHTTARWVASRAAFVAECAAAEAAALAAVEAASADDEEGSPLLRWRAARRIQTSFRAHSAR